ncbi:transcriptional regulator, XRE family with cupin sensor [Carboxydocella thermautotrophica]|nr:transcriptional regulator, XRE family with cupin sensor [Carboxydocella thermautotrophica]
MENLNSVIASNLKRIREERKLSLDKMAQLTGVSKSMLSKIEREEANPTIAIMWKIANGLKISFTSLLNSPQSATELIRHQELQPLVEDNGKYYLYPYFPYEEGRRFEIYGIEIKKGGSLQAEPHGQGTQEFITVFSGELTIQVGLKEYVVRTGDAIRFKADRPHAYFNAGEETVRAQMVIFYPE